HYPWAPRSVTDLVTPAGRSRTGPGPRRFTMNPHLLLAAMILVAASLVVLLMGYLIGSLKELSLIAGLDVSKVRDSDGLARWIGRGLLSIGMLDLLIGLALFVIPVPPALLVIAYVVVSLVGAAVLQIGMRRYLR